MSKALLIVDVQNDFCTGGSLAVAGGDEVVEPLNRMIEHANKMGWPVIASRDWHPAVTKHFKKYGGIWPAHCVQNTPGAEFHPKLKLLGEGTAAYVVSKGMGADEDAYDAFAGLWGEMPFEAFLLQLQINELYIGGLATDHCVRATVLKARELGFKVTLLIDACRAVNIKFDDGDRAISAMVAAGARISTTNVVINENGA